MPRTDADDPWEYIFPSRYAHAGLQLHLSVRRSPYVASAHRHRIRRLGAQLPEGARIAPGRPLDAFAVGRRAAAQRRACVAAQGVQPHGTALGAGPMAGVTVTRYDALP
jgi:hypothetical protein